MKTRFRKIWLTALAALFAMPAAAHAEWIPLDRSYLIMDLTPKSMVPETPMEECQDVANAYVGLLRTTIVVFRQLGYIATVKISPQEALPLMERDLRLFGHPEVASALNFQLTALDHKSLMVCPKA